MAENYTLFSFRLGFLPDETLKFARELDTLLHDICFEDRDHEDLIGDENPLSQAALRVAMVSELENFRSWDNRIVIDGKVLYVHHDENGNVEQAVAFLQEILRHADSKKICTLEWAETCSKPRPGEFGGGVVVFNQNKALWKFSREIGRDLALKLAESPT